MHFEKLVPNIFYIDITEGLKLFIDLEWFVKARTQAWLEKTSTPIKAETMEDKLAQLKNKFKS